MKTTNTIPQRRLHGVWKIAVKTILAALLIFPSARLSAQTIEAPETRAAASALAHSAQAVLDPLDLKRLEQPTPATDEAVGPEEAGDVTDEEASRPPTSVTPDIWRSSRPNFAALERLYDMGVKTIVNLEGGKPYKQEKELLLEIEAKRAAEGKPAWHIESIAVPMSGIAPPSFDQVDRALAVMANPVKRPLLVHCKHGEDRTGVTVASFRVAIEKKLSIFAAVLEAKSFRCCHLVLIGENSLFRYLKVYLFHRR